MFRHVVLFRVRDDVTDPDLSAALDALSELGIAPEVEKWKIALSLDARKGRVIIEDGTFPSRAAFEAWKASSNHTNTALRLGSIADWLVGDYEVTRAEDLQ